MNCLFVGTGKGIGRALSQHYQEQGHSIFSITGTRSDDPNTLCVDWATVNEAALHRWLCDLPILDLIFFNQNSSSLSQPSFATKQLADLDLWRQIKHWRQSYYVSCQMCFQVIHSLAPQIHSDTRVIWMLTSMVMKQDHDTDQSLGYADYIGNKYQNYLLMRNFSINHVGCFLALQPGNVNGSDHADKIQTIQTIISRPKNEINGRVFAMSGQLSQTYQNLP